MAEFARRPEQFRLAISLHAPTSAQRLGIMPIEKKYDLEAVLKAAEAFRRRVTFEYVMIGGVNDSDADADRLAKLARRLGALVNILPLHPGGAPDLTPTSSTENPGLRGPAAESGHRGNGPAQPRPRHRRGVRTVEGRGGEEKRTRVSGERTT